MVTLSHTEEVLTTPAVNQPIALTVEEVLIVEHQPTLAYRGTEVQPDIFLDEDLFFNCKHQCTLTQLARAKVMPKLAKMGIPMTILVKLTSTQLTEVLYMVIVILYHSKAQEMDIPHYIPDC